MTIEEVSIQLEREWNNIKKNVPKQYHDAFDSYCYIAGGAIYRLLNDQEPKDYDIFCSDYMFLQSLTDLVPCDIKTHNAITFCKGKYQIVLKDIGPMEEVISRFDFYHNFAGWSVNKGVSIFTEEEKLRSNKLEFNFNRARDIANCILRVPKFVSRGMKITKKEMALMIKKLLSESNFKDEIHQMDDILHGSGY